MKLSPYGKVSYSAMLNQIGSAVQLNMAHISTE
jgi:hypothetical protein